MVFLYNYSFIYLFIYIDASSIEAFKEQYNTTYNNMMKVFDEIFEVLANSSSVVASEENKKRNIAAVKETKFLYSEINESNEYRGYFNLNNTFIMIVQKNMNDSEATQENVYKLQLTVSVDNKSKCIYILLYSIIK